jgi:hypothetical protein
MYFDTHLEAQQYMFDGGGSIRTGDPKVNGGLPIGVIDNHTYWLQQVGGPYQGQFYWYGPDAGPLDERIAARKILENMKGGEMDKDTFWRQVMCGDGWQRFVAKTELVSVEVTDVEEGGYSDVVTRRLEENIEFKLFVPETVDDDYNLVLSLCTDGAHRPVLDLDFGKDALQFKPGSETTRFYVTDGGSRSEVTVPGVGVVVPSTNHCHLYTDVPLSFRAYVELLQQVPGDDARKYASNVSVQGFGSARPPWIRKGDVSDRKVTSQIPDLSIEYDEVFDVKTGKVIRVPRIPPMNIKEYF